MEQKKKSEYEGIWFKETPSGGMGGSILIDTTQLPPGEYYINIYQNQYKVEGDNRPDFNYKINPKKAATQKASAPKKALPEKSPFAKAAEQKSSIIVKKEPEKKLDFNSMTEDDIPF